VASQRGPSGRGAWLEGAAQAASVRRSGTRGRRTELGG